METAPTDSLQSAAESNAAYWSRALAALADYPAPIYAVDLAVAARFDLHSNTQLIVKRIDLVVDLRSSVFAEQNRPEDLRSLSLATFYRVAQPP